MVGSYHWLQEELFSFVLKKFLNSLLFGMASNQEKLQNSFDFLNIRLEFLEMKNIVDLN